MDRRRCPNCRYVALEFDELDLTWVCQQCDAEYDSEDLDEE